MKRAQGDEGGEMAEMDKLQNMEEGDYTENDN